MNSTINIDINYIRVKLIEKLEINGWDKALKNFIMSSDFKAILKALKNEVDQGKRFTPPLKSIFRTFEHTPYTETKVLIIGQDPYPQLDTADGIAFSCSRKGKAEKSLQYIFKSLNPTQWDSLDPDLKRWCKQGVLCINTALTVEIKNIGSHYHIWKPFTTYLLDHINHNLKCNVILMGKKAEEWGPLLNKQKLFKVAHPASAAYKGGVWDDKNVFANVNKELEINNQPLIIW